MIFKFNIWKHHLRGALAEMNKLKEARADLFHKKIIPLLGNNVVDIYIGRLTEENIQNELADILQKENHYSLDDFSSWLKGTEFRKVTLSDNSVWVLRLGFSNEQYIHIHPGKHSPHTFRTSSNALKTAYYLYYSGNIEKLSLGIINKIRKEELKLSPVHSVEEMNKCRTLLKFLTRNICI
mgnify:CR=1 FL=1